MDIFHQYTGELPEQEEQQKIKFYIDQLIYFSSPTVHFFKTEQPFFDEFEEKTFEIRKKDRDFNPGDVLVLREYPYTKRWIIAEIFYVLESKDCEGIKEGYCVLGLGQLVFHHSFFLLREYRKSLGNNEDS